MYVENSGIIIPQGTATPATKDYERKREKATQAFSKGRHTQKD